MHARNLMYNNSIDSYHITSIVFFTNNSLLRKTTDKKFSLNVSMDMQKFVLPRPQNSTATRLSSIM